MLNITIQDELFGHHQTETGEILTENTEKQKNPNSDRDIFKPKGNQAPSIK